MPGCRRSRHAQRARGSSPQGPKRELSSLAQACGAIRHNCRVVHRPGANGQVVPDRVTAEKRRCPQPSTPRKWLARQGKCALVHSAGRGLLLPLPINRSPMREDSREVGAAIRADRKRDRRTFRAIDEPCAATSLVRVDTGSTRCVKRNDVFVAPKPPHEVCRNYFFLDKPVERSGTTRRLSTEGRRRADLFMHRRHPAAPPAHSAPRIASGWRDKEKAGLSTAGRSP